MAIETKDRVDGLLVVIPIVNDNPFFSECLESLDKQTLDKNKFTLFLSVNNRTPDVVNDIKKRVSSYEFDYVIEYSDILNSGNARNLGLAYAQQNGFDYLVFIDDDDLISESYLGELLSKISFSTFDIVVSNVMFRVGDSDEDHPYAEDYRKKDTSSMFKVRRFFNSPWMKIFRVGTIGEYRFPDLKRSQDVVFMTRLSREIKSIGFTGDESIYYVRKRLDSTSRKKQNFFYELYYRFIVVFKYILPLIFKKGYSIKFLLSRCLAQLILIVKNSF